MAGKDVKKWELSCITGKNVKQYTHLKKKKPGTFSKMLKVELPYDPETPFLGTVPKK